MEDHTTTRTEDTIVVIVNLTSSTIFSTTFIVALTKNNFGI